MSHRIERPSFLAARCREEGLTFADHKPCFRTRDEAEFIIIYDGPRALATLSRESLYFDWREWYPDGRAGTGDDIRRPYHNPSIRGTTIVNNWRLDGAQRVCSQACRITIIGQGSGCLVIRLDETFGPDEQGFHELRIGYDRAWGSYVVDTAAELALHRPHAIEVSNLWSRGAGECWPGDVELHYTLWTNAEGGLTYFPHNPLTPNLPGNMDAHGRRRLPVGGFLGLVRRPKSNPVIEVLASSTESLGFATCSCWYDEHLLMGNPLPPWDDGKYRWAIRYRVFSIPPELADRLLKEAVMLDLGDTPSSADDWRYLDSIRAAGRQLQPFDTSLPFVPGEINDFSVPIDPRQGLVGLYWAYDPQPGGRVSWDREQAALRMEGRDACADLASRPCGPSVMMHEGCRYRFEADIRTDLNGDAEAWIEGATMLYTPQDARDTQRSQAIHGAADWTRVAVRLDKTPEVDYLCLALRLRGAGRAWFRRVALIEETAVRS